MHTGKVGSMVGIASQPAFILQYGDSGTGKTTDALYSFPRAFWIAAPGSLKPSVGVCGYDPPEEFVFDAPTIKDAGIKAAEVVARHRTRIDAVVVDDLTLLVDRTVADFQRRNVSGYDLWGGVYRHMLALREVARRLGVHVLMNTHANHPKIEGGIFYKGSAALPGKKLPYQVPAACDMVLRTEPAAQNSVSVGWPVLYRCTPDDPSWLTKDRHNATPDFAPMNIGEILRSVAREIGPSFAPRRLLGLEWQEEIVERCATAMEGKLDDTEHVKSVLAAAHERAAGKFKATMQHAIWTQRDAYDRAVLRNAIARHRRRLYG